MSSASDRSVVRSAALRGFHSLVLELGGDPETVARDAGLDPAALLSDELLVPGRAVAAALEIAAGRLECPDLGLRVASRQDLSMLGALALAMRSSATVGEALECCSQYLSVHARSIGLRVVPDPYGDSGLVGLRWTVASGAALAPAQATDLGLAFGHRTLRALTGGPYGLRTVDLPHAPVAAPEVYRSYFGTEVRFRRPTGLLRVPASLLRRPVAGQDEFLRQLAVTYLDHLAPSSSTAVSARVRVAVSQALGTSEANLDAIADLLATHPRTLQRRLLDEGTTFAEIVDEARKEAAQRYLQRTDMPFTQVAALLSLSEQSALARCCRRWWDKTPSQVRQQRTLSR